MSPVAHMIGRSGRVEFQAPNHDILLTLQQYHWTSVSHDRMPTSLDEADFVVLFQSRPNEFSPSSIFDLKNRDPLAPWLLIAGACAEGEARTGRPPSGCHRIYVWQWNHFYLQELTLLLQKRPSLFTFPTTFDSDEKILYHTQINVRHRSSGDCGGVPPSSPAPNSMCTILAYNGPFGNDNAMNHMLADLSTQNGFFVVSKIDNTFSGKILADVDDSPPDKILKAVQRLRADFADAEIVLYVNSPRINEKRDLLTAGADEVLAKPGFW